MNKKKFNYRGRNWTLDFRYGGYYLTAMYKGKRICSALGTSSISEAVALAKDKLDEVVTGKYVKGKQPAGAMTWGQYFGFFESKADSYVQSKHVRHYLWIMRKVLKDMIGENYEDVSTIYPTEAQVENWKIGEVSKRQKQQQDVARGKRYVNSMLRQVGAFVGATWQQRLGVKLGEGAENIVQAKRYHRVPVPVFRPTPDLIERTLQWGRELMPQSVDAYRVFWLVMGTGARRGEVKQIRWEHIVKDVRPVVIQGDFITKDGSEAYLQFVFPEAWEKFSAAGFPESEGYILGPPRLRRAEKAFDYLCSGLKGLGFTGRYKLHELRAAVITKVFECHGIKSAQTVARHKSASTTDKYIRYRLPEVGEIEF